MVGLGDYVTATLVGGINGEPRQGIVTELHYGGTMTVRGEMGDYKCYQDGAVVVETFAERQKVRNNGSER